MSRRSTRSRQRGFALLIVLWTLVLLSLIVTHLASTGRTEARIASNLEASAIAEAAADGITFEAVFHMLDNSGSRWSMVNSQHQLKLNGGVATITIEAENAKINPNIAAPELLAALIHETGLETAMAGRLAAAIADWRDPGDTPRPGGAKLAQYEAAGLDYGPPGEPFQSIDELGRVLGMTPAILDAIRPYLSLYQIGLPDPALAAPLVNDAMRRAGNSPDAAEIRPANASAVTIVARVVMTHGGQFVRKSVVRMGSSFAQGYAIMAWDAEPAT